MIRNHQHLQAFRAGQSSFEGRRVQLSEPTAEGHIQRLTDLYDGLIAQDDQPGDRAQGKGRVEVDNGPHHSELTYQGDTGEGRGELYHRTSIEQIAQSTRFSEDSIEQLQVHRNYRGQSVSLLHLDRNDPSQSYQIFV